MEWSPNREALRGRVAVVAGATRGAGRGIAAALGEAGATVICTGRTTRSMRSEYNRAETIEETAEFVTQLGGVGLLIPNVPRLTEWVYAGLTINLLLAFYSQLNGGGSTWDKFDPILVMAFVFASYVLRRCMRANRWSI